MTNQQTPKKPCPAYVVSRAGYKQYCEGGEEGHRGTCFGRKTQYQYEQELEAYEDWKNEQGDSMTDPDLRELSLEEARRGKHVAAEAYALIRIGDMLEEINSFLQGTVQVRIDSK